MVKYTNIQSASGARMTLPVGTEALGQSESFLAFQECLSRVAGVNRPVLLMGERGTGKELASARLHYLSRRWQEPFVALNCAALSATLIEAELFGHEKGAFTGAAAKRAGRFEAADRGTLFLDEIGSIPLPVQEKILRVVEYGAFERVGGSSPVEADVRLIGATNVDLIQLTESGKFKRDLLDRLSFEVLFLPPLRERKGDIPLLADHFARRMAFELGKMEIPVFGERAMAALEAHSWPGNIRELKNVVERAVYRSPRRVIQDVDFDPFQSPYPPLIEKPQQRLRSEAPGAAPPELLNLPLKTAVKRLERLLLQGALKKTRNNQKKAASLLGLTYDQFRGMYRKHHFDKRTA
jgi:psp operon transcriptional activator